LNPYVARSSNPSGQLASQPASQPAGTGLAAATSDLLLMAANHNLLNSGGTA